MRLTKHLRECFVRAVFADIPKPVEPTFEVLQAELCANFHPLIKAVFDDETLRQHLDSSYYYVNGVGGRNLVTCGQEYEKMPTYVAWLHARDAYNKSRSQLRAVADGCTNLKQLQESLPELIKYMVSEEKPTPVNLPAITGTVDALKALGWKQ